MGITSTGPHTSGNSRLIGLSIERERELDGEVMGGCWWVVFGLGGLGLEMEMVMVMGLEGPKGWKTLLANEFSCRLLLPLLLHLPLYPQENPPVSYPPTTRFYPFPLLNFYSFFFVFFFCTPFHIAAALSLNICAIFCHELTGSLIGIRWKNGKMENGGYFAVICMA